MRRLARDFDRQGPWLTRFRVGRQNYGGHFDYSTDIRILDFTARVPPSRVLELGALEGGQTVELAKRGYRVTAIEGRPANVLRARWILDVLRLDADVLEADLNTVRLDEFGRFDAVFCSGLLYHLPRPWELIKQFREVAPVAFVSTHYAEKRETQFNGRSGRWFTEGGWDDPLSGLSSRSFWLTRNCLIAECRRAGFSVEVIRDMPHEYGPIVNLYLRD
jgi:SAM-dependent methyltransferase